MLDPVRCRLLRVAQRRTNMSDTDFKQLVALYGKDCPGMVDGQPSTKQLNLQAFDRLMKHFEGLGFVSTAKQALRSSDRRPGAATLKQISMVERLWRDYTVGMGDMRSLGLWLENTFKVSSARFLTFAQARKAITALNAMIERPKKTTIQHNQG